MSQLLDSVDSASLRSDIPAFREVAGHHALLVRHPLDPSSWRDALATVDGALRGVADHSVVVPTDRTDRAQEVHLCIEHAICELIEAELGS